MRTNYVLIDQENVQPKPEALASLMRDCFRVYLFVGSKQPNVNFGVAEAMQRLGSSAAYIRIAGRGPNALDFHIAYYIGNIAVDDPSAYFHIISKDKGFDPLISHLKDNGIFASRSTTIHDIPVVKVLDAKSVEDKIVGICNSAALRSHAE